jgi:hypothetical protein
MWLKTTLFVFLENLDDLYVIKTTSTYILNQKKNVLIRTVNVARVKS